MKGICRLCEVESELRESHIIPKFVFRWLKQTGTGYFRDLDNPNVRIQDGKKHYLLCGVCERLFSEREDYFASTIFRPFIAGTKAVNYDERLAYFAISVLWRVIQQHLADVRLASSAIVALLENANTEWRNYLLSRKPLVHFCETHLFVFDLAKHSPPEAEFFNLFCNRATATTFFEDKECWYVVAKFARFMFVSILGPHDQNLWDGTSITVGTGRIQMPQTIRDLRIGGWIRERAEFASKQMQSGFSTRQGEVIRSHLQKNWGRLQGSDLLRVAQADEQESNWKLNLPRKIGRNESCPCGSGLKYKKCHGR